MKVYFFNTLTGKKQEFCPQDPNLVKIYSCGPTVYNYNHIGNFRSYLFVDVLRRSLKLLGYNLNQTMNITDIDDKIINESIKNQISIEDFTKKWIDAFFEDLQTLNVDKVENYPRATESISEMMDIIKRLESNQMIYEKDGSIYYSIKNFNKYGELSKIDVSGMKSGARYDADEYEKEDIRDFVLWKSNKLENEKFWETPYGKGRPGWHLECSAMIRKVYNSGIDIHTGGVDLVFPHHENEIAQSKGAFPQESFVNYWLHCEHLLVENQKMSKSKGNFYTLRDLISKNYSPKAIRYTLLSFHYRTKLNFSLSRIDESEKAIQRIQNTLDRILEITNYEVVQSKPTHICANHCDEFLQALSDDLNVPKALACIFDSIKEFNLKLDTNSVSTNEALDISSYFYTIDQLLGILNFEKLQLELNDQEIEELIQKRVQARLDKNFKLADDIRNILTEKGIILEDTKTGIKWKRK